MKTKKLTDDRLSGQLVRVVVSIQSDEFSQTLSIDPWHNCPSEIIKEEGRFCNDCEFWGGKVEGIDWHEFSLCLFDCRL